MSNRVRGKGGRGEEEGGGTGRIRGRWKEGDEEEGGGGEDKRRVGHRKGREKERRIGRRRKGEGERRINWGKGKQERVQDLKIKIIKKNKKK